MMNVLAGHPQDPMAMLAQAPLSATEPALASTGAKGAAAHELMRRFFAQNRTAYTAAVRRNMSICAEGKFDPDDSRCMSARAHFCNEVPVGNARTLAFLGFGLSMAWDALAAEEPAPGSPAEAALDILSRLLVAVEQSAIDNSRWEVAWPLTHLPEPPWGRLQSAVKNDESRFATLANPSWVTTVMALKKDLAALHESRRKRPPPKGGQGADA